MTSEDDKEGVFIDASVWIAAAGSPTGGSSLVLDVCCGRRFKALCSQRVLQEAQTNLRDKLPVEAMVRFYKLMAAVAPGIVSPVARDEEAQYGGAVAEKDAHVVAAAVRGGATYLVTLDRKHLATAEVREAGLPIQILLPGEFINLVLR
jgi:putative PIN family toxin of toxin-antitoxin system